MHSTDSILEAETLAAGAYGEAGMPVAGEGAPWWRSSRSPSSPPRWGCRPMRGSGTSATPSSSGTGCRGSGGGCSPVVLRPWLARRIAEKTLLLSQDAAGLWTGTWPRPRTGSDPARWTGWWTRRSAATCPPKQRPVASRGRMAGTSPSSRGRSTPSTAPWPSTANSIWPTPWSWRPRSRRSPPSSRTSGPRSPSMSAAPERSVSWPGVSCRWSSRWLRRALRARLETTPGRSCSTSISPRTR